MNKKLIFAGGEPNITIDNLNRNPEANLAALNAICAGIGAGGYDFIISGSISLDPGTSLEVAAGYVFLNGEVLQMDAQSIPDTEGTDLYEISKQTTYDSLGDKVFNNGVARQTYQVNRAVFTSVAAITGTDALGLATLNLRVAPQATESIAGRAAIATQAVVITGTDDTKIVTPLKLKTLLDDTYVADTGWLDIDDTDIDSYLTMNWGRARSKNGVVSLSFNIDMGTLSTLVSGYLKIGDLPAEIDAPSENVYIGVSPTVRSGSSQPEFVARINTDGSVNLYVAAVSGAAATGISGNASYII